MTSNAVATSDLTAAPSVLSAAVRTRILLYLGVLLLLLGFGSPGGGLIGLPISFLLKNKLELKAHELAIFSLIAGVPSYLSILFGFARDTWNPLGMRDRGFIALFGGICAVVYLLFTFAPVTYRTLLAAQLLLGTCFPFVASAQNGLTSTLGQQHVMSGQISAVWNITAALPGIIALILGGCQVQGVGCTDEDILRDAINSGGDTPKNPVRDRNQGPYPRIDVPQKRACQRARFG